MVSFIRRQSILEATSQNGSQDRGCQMGGIRNNAGKGELLLIPTASRWLSIYYAENFLAKFYSVFG